MEGRFVIGDEEIVLTPVSSRSTVAAAVTSNGRLATAAELAERGRALVDLHGQHAHQSLLLPAEQRALLDRFAGDTGRRRARRAARRPAPRGGGSTRSCDDRWRRAFARPGIDLLRYQLDEIDAAAIDDADEDGPLAAEEELLADAEAHREALDAAHGKLEGPARGRARRAL